MAAMSDPDWPELEDEEQEMLAAPPKRSLRLREFGCTGEVYEETVVDRPPLLPTALSRSHSDGVLNLQHMNFGEGTEARCALVPAMGKVTISMLARNLLRLHANFHEATPPRRQPQPTAAACDDAHARDAPRQRHHGQRRGRHRARVHDPELRRVRALVVHEADQVAVVLGAGAAVARRALDEHALAAACRSIAEVSSASA